jgi:hypothetical protein
MTKIDWKKCTVVIKDGGGNNLTVTLGEGGLTYNEKKNIMYDKNRGRLDGVSEGDEEPVEFSLEARYETLSSDTGDPPTLREAFNQIGEASDWVSVGDPCEPYAVDIQMTYNPTCDDVKSEIVLLPEARHESLDMDPKSGTLRISGKCNVKLLTALRTTASSG